MNHIIQPSLWTSSEKRTWMATLFLGTVALYAARMAIPITITSIAKKSEWTKTESGTVLSCFFWGYMLSQVLGGYLSDNLGGEIVLLLSVTGWSLMSFFTPEIVLVFYDSEKALFLTSASRVIFGAFQGVHFPTLASLIAKNVHTSEKTFFSSVIAAGPSLGMLLSGSIGSFILEQYGWPYVHRATGLLGLLWVVIIRYHILDRRKTDYVGVDKSKTKFDQVPWFSFFKSGAFWSVIIAHYCHNNCFFILLSWLPTYFQEKFPHQKGWVFNFVPWLFVPITSIGAGWISEKLVSKGWDVIRVRKLMELVSGAILGVLITAFAYVDSFSISLFILSIAVASGGLHSSGAFMNAHDIAPQYVGSILGIINAVGAIPGFVGVYIVGHILDRWKNWAIVFIFTAALNTLGCICFLVYGSDKPIVPLDLKI